jgi:manganese/iron transport system permease protein
MDALQWLSEPLNYGFMVRGLLAAIMVGVICPVIGCYMILRGMSFFGDALSHAILPGIVLTYLLSLPLALGALVAGITAALLIGAISQRGNVQEDTAIGIVFAGSFALGVALMSTVNGYAVDLSHILFGDVLGVTARDLWFTLALGIIVLAIVAAFYKELLVLTFDPALALVLRLPARFLRYLLFMLIAVTIVVSLQTVGISLMLAMLVTPAAAAQLLTRRLPAMMAAAALIGVTGNVIGLYVSFYINIASGPAMVLVATALFALVFLFAPQRGILWRRTGKKQQQPTTG